MYIMIKGNMPTSSWILESLWWFTERKLCARRCISWTTNIPAVPSVMGQLKFWRVSIKTPKSLVRSLRNLIRVLLISFKVDADLKSTVLESEKQLGLGIKKVFIPQFLYPIAHARKWKVTKVDTYCSIPRVKSI